MRYLLFREDDCPGCGGDGWRVDDLEGDDTCPTCSGLGWIYTEVAILPAAEAEKIVTRYKESIPFAGDQPRLNREVTQRDYVGL